MSPRIPMKCCKCKKKDKIVLDHAFSEIDGFWLPAGWCVASTGEKQDSYWQLFFMCGDCQ